MSEPRLRDAEPRYMAALEENDVYTPILMIRSTEIVEALDRLTAAVLTLGKPELRKR